MILARNETTDELALEAFEFGVPLPFVVRKDGSWMPAAIDVDTLHQDFTDVSHNDALSRGTIEKAEAVVVYLSDILGMDRFDDATLGEVRQRLKERTGSVAVTLNDVTRHNKMTVAAASATAVPG